MAYQWNHEDSRGLAAAIPLAVTRAFTNAWSLPPELPASGAVAQGIQQDFRALLAGTMIVLDSLSTKAIDYSALTGSTAIKLTTHGDSDFAADRLPYATALLTTLRNLYIPIAKTTHAPNTTGGPGMLYVRIGTVDGAAWSALVAPGGGDAGWVAVALELVSAAVQAAVVVFLVEKGAEVVDRELSRREESARMMQYHASLLSLLAAHAKREQDTYGKDAGKPGCTLPFDAAEQAALDALKAAQLAQIGAVKKEMPSIFPDLKGQGGEVVKAAKQLGFGVLVLGGGLLYLLLRKG